MDCHEMLSRFSQRHKNKLLNFKKLKVCLKLRVASKNAGFKFVKLVKHTLTDDFINQNYRQSVARAVSSESKIGYVYVVAG